MGQSPILSLFLFHLADKYFATKKLPDTAFDIHMHRVPAYPIWMRETSDKEAYASYATSIEMLNTEACIEPDWTSIQSVTKRYEAFEAQDEANKQKQINIAICHSLMPNPLFDEDVEDSIFSILLSKLDINWRDFMNLNEIYFNNMSKAALLAIGREITQNSDWADNSFKKETLVKNLSNLVDPTSPPPHLDEASRLRAANWLPPVLNIGINTTAEKR